MSGTSPSILIDLVSILFVGIVLVAFGFGLRWGVASLILVRPLCDRIFELSRFEVAGHLVSYGAIMNIVVVVGMIFYFPAMWRCTPRPLRSIWFPFLLICLFAVSYSPQQVDAFRKFLTYVSMFAMFMFAFVIVRSERDVILFSKAVIFSSIVPVCYGFFQLLSGIDWYEQTRIHSTFPHPNMFAFYLLAVIGFILFLIVSREFRLTGKARFYLGAYLVPLLVLLVMTKTRSAWAGCLVLFVLYGIIYDVRVLIGAMLLPAVAVFIPGIADRITDLASGNEYAGWAARVNAFAWRQILWDITLQYVWQKPIIGYGLNSFSSYSPSFFPLEPDRGVDTHNVYLQVLFETGLVGLICFLWLFVRIFTWLYHCWRFDKRGVSLIATLVGVYMLACFSDNIFEYLSFDWCFWFAIGLALVRINYSRVSAGMLNFKMRNELGAEGGTRVRATRSGLAG